MSKEICYDKKPHFEISHACAGCAVSMHLHTGCVVNGDVRIHRSGNIFTSSTPTVVASLESFPSPSEKLVSNTLSDDLVGLG